MRSRVRLALALVLTLAPAGAARAGDNWISDITGSSLSVRGAVELMQERVVEKAAEGLFCIDVEYHDGDVYALFVESPVITDAKILRAYYPYYLSPPDEDAGWRQIDFEILGHGMPDEIFYVAVYIKTDGITGDGYFARSDFDEFIERKRESEERDNYIIDMERIDGSWWALLGRSPGLFSGHATISSRSSFPDLKDRMEELEDSGNRTIDIECVGGKWYGLSVRTDEIGNTGMFSRSDFDDFTDRIAEIRAEGKYLIDIEIDDNGFYGLVVKSTAD